MISKEYSILKNGSDIRGVALEGVEGESVNLTNDKVLNIGNAFVLWLCEKTKKSSKDLKIAIGYDSRLSSKNIEECLVKAFANSGSTVFRCGLSSTPSMFMACIDTLFCDGSIEITASHLPFNRNGLKFFTKDGGLESADISAILEFAFEGKKVNSDFASTPKEFDFISSYSEILKDFIKKGVNSKIYDKPLSGFKIVVDAGNGVGGFFAHKVLLPLGADITGSQFLEPDGSFPNHIPNPEDNEAMDAISNCVIQNKADFGIIFDTDVDRSAAVDKNGKEINKNRLIALISAIILEETPNATIVTDSITSSGLKSFIEELGGKHHRFKRGYKNVINEAKRLNEEGIHTPLAIETSGHCAFKENYFLDDGAYLITKLLIKMAKLKEEGLELSDLIKDLKEPAEAKEFRIKILTENFKEYGQKVLDDLLIFCKEQNFLIASDNYEGIRVSFDKENGDGWFLLRLSLHDPILPLNIESDSENGVKPIAKILETFLNKYELLNIDGLKTYIR